MKKVTKSRINAIENAATFIKTMDGFCGGLNDSEIKDHHVIGDLMEKNAKEIVKLLIKIENENTKTI